MHLPDRAKNPSRDRTLTPGNLLHQGADGQNEETEVVTGWGDVAEITELRGRVADRLHTNEKHHLRKVG